MLFGWQQASRTGSTALVVLVMAFMAFSVAPPPVSAEEVRRDDVSPGFDHDAWKNIREMLYEGQAIKDGKDVISLTVPRRAEDAAIVPITIAAVKPQTKDEYIESITLVIDQNPSPVGPIFHLTPDSGLATIDTRVRINAFTDIRVIAKTNDGRLFMAAKFIKAAGGCGAPGLSEMDEALARAGQMKMKFLASSMEGVGGQAQLMIRHPNFSGLQMDQISSEFIPAHYVDSVEVTRGGTKILSMEGEISLSEDPSIRFNFGADTAGDISVVVTDTHGKTFRKSWPVSKPTKS